MHTLTRKIPSLWIYELYSLNTNLTLKLILKLFNVFCTVSLKENANLLRTINAWYICTKKLTPIL